MAEQRIAGHYRILDRLATGGMGVVWLARDERLQRLVAVKQLSLHPELSASATDNARTRVLREARIAARVQHPNAVTIFDVTEHGTQPCVVMEYLPSRSLATLVTEHGPMSPIEVAAIGRQVADALAAAHRAQIVHGDVKPGNILVTDTGTAKITDFSVSRAPGAGTVTETGMVAGTPAYLAPEVARGQDPTAAADVFGLGASLYAAVEGRGPFGRYDDEQALLRAAAAGRIQPVERAGALAPVLRGALAVDPAERVDMDRLRDLLPDGDTGQTERTVPSPIVYRPPGAADRRAAADTAGGGRSVAAGRRGIPVKGGALVAAAAVAFALAGFAAGRALDQPEGEPLRAEAPLAPGPPGGIPVPEAPAGPASAGPAGSAPEPAPEPATEPATEPTPPPNTETAPETSAPSSEPAPDHEPESEPSPSPTEPAPETEEASAEQASSIDGSGDPIAWSAAGSLVIDYYAGAENPGRGWGMLTANAQDAFGGRDEFREHWDRYSQVWAQNASGVGQNADGSVTVPVDVIYTTGDDRRREHREVRVIRQDGQLLIDTEAR